MSDGTIIIEIEDIFLVSWITQTTGNNGKFVDNLPSRVRFSDMPKETKRAIEDFYRERIKAIAPHCNNVLIR